MTSRPIPPGAPGSRPVDRRIRPEGDEDERPEPPEARRVEDPEVVEGEHEAHQHDEAQVQPGARR